MQIIIISIEGKESITERKFYEKIASKYQNNIAFYSHAHSIKDKNTNMLVANIKDWLNKHSDESNDKDFFKNTKVFIIHDDDVPKQKDILDETYKCFVDILTKFHLTNITRIYDKGKAFDSFLYCCIIKTKDINSINMKNLKYFIVQYSIKSNNIGLWKFLYEKFNAINLDRNQRMEHVIQEIVKLDINSKHTIILKEICNLLQ